MSLLHLTVLLRDWRPEVLENLQKGEKGFGTWFSFVVPDWIVELDELQSSVALPFIWLLMCVNCPEDGAVKPRGTFWD